MLQTLSPQVNQSKEQEQKDSLIKIVLVKEGVFPISLDHEGNRIAETPNTGWNHAGTVQGEGKLTGVPSLFIRLAACNLRCMWQMPDKSLCNCDTAYASFNIGDTHYWNTQKVVDTVRHNLGDIKHVVISGGEPMLQATALAKLCKQLKNDLKLHITLETNGTLFEQRVAPYIDLVSISPKLANSNPSKLKADKAGFDYQGTFNYHADIRNNTEVIQQWINYSKIFSNDFQLKFVVADAREADEIKVDFIDKLSGWKQDDILIMPLGANKDQLAVTTPIAVQMAVQNAWRFSQRLHIDIWGSKMGV